MKKVREIITDVIFFAVMLPLVMLFAVIWIIAEIIVKIVKGVRGLLERSRKRQ